jgi:hypothetical protein
MQPKEGRKHVGNIVIGPLAQSLDSLRTCKTVLTSELEEEISRHSAVPLAELNDCVVCLGLDCSALI